jgi:hypothetical protein
MGRKKYGRDTVLYEGVRRGQYRENEKVTCQKPTFYSTYPEQAKWFLEGRTDLCASKLDNVTV